MSKDAAFFIEVLNRESRTDNQQLRIQSSIEDHLSTVVNCMFLSSVASLHFSFFSFQSSVLDYRRKQEIRFKPVGPCFINVGRSPTEVVPQKKQHRQVLLFFFYYSQLPLTNYQLLIVVSRVMRQVTSAFRTLARCSTAAITTCLGAGKVKYAGSILSRWRSL